MLNSGWGRPGSEHISATLSRVPVELEEVTGLQTNPGVHGTGVNEVLAGLQSPGKLSWG